MSGIHQFVPMLHRADAVGRHTLRLRDVMVGRGIPSHIYVERETPRRQLETRPFARYAEEAEAGDVLLYQFATASALGPWLGARHEVLVVNYHNVTPAEYYAPWDNGLARHQLLAQAQLRELAPRAALGLAVSSFNEAELRQAGFRRTAVVPPAGIMPAGPANGAAGADGATAATSGARWVTSGASPRTRASSWRSWRCWWPGSMTIPRRRSRWWAGRWCRPIPPRCIASSTRWACTTLCCSAARSATPRWLPPWPGRTSSC